MKSSPTDLVTSGDRPDEVDHAGVYERHGASHTAVNNGGINRAPKSLNWLKFADSLKMLTLTVVVILTLTLSVTLINFRHLSSESFRRNTHVE